MTFDEWWDKKAAKGYIMFIGDEGKDIARETWEAGQNEILQNTGPGTPIARLEYIIDELWKMCGCEDPEPFSSRAPELRVLKILGLKNDKNNTDANI